MINTIGIIGSGKMGSDIFNYLSDFNFTLKWFILFEDEKEKLHKSFHKKIARQLKHDLINEEQFERKESFLFSTELLDFSDCDLIIESIPEELELKQHLFRQLNHIVHKSCLIASNSSSILPSKLSLQREIIGMHFFYPVSFKNTVELIRYNDNTSNNYLMLEEFLKSIGKKVFKQTNETAFLLNRFLLDIQLKAFDLVHSHDMDYIHFDHIVKDLIPDFGVFEMIDEVGLQTMHNAVYNYAQMDDNPNRYNLFLGEINKKIKSDFIFCNVNEDIEIEPGLANYIHNDIKYFIATLCKDYIERYNLNEAEFKTYLNDFCGIML